jgi:RimJ/RimL family protein N-acetyltransferase
MNTKPKPLFTAGDLTVRPYVQEDIPAILEVYRLNEDFLSLGPHPIASLVMVRDDIAQSQQEKGLFCVIANRESRIIGVMDFAPHRGEDGASFLALLMIAAPFRNSGCGKAILDTFEKYLVKTYQTTVLKAGVMVNNPHAIRFWERMGFSLNRTPELLPDKTTIFRMSKKLG